MPRHAARCGPAPAHTRLTPGLRRPVRFASSSCGRVMNIHDVRDRRRQTSDVRQHHCLMPPPRGGA